MSNAFKEIKTGLEQAIDYAKGNTDGSITTHYT